MKGYAERFAHIVIDFARCGAEIVGDVLTLEEMDARGSVCFRKAVKR